jgi:4-hydroxy-tetrahydrodipicolinate reductase
LFALERTDLKIKVCLAGATGWVGRALSKAIHESKEFELVAAVGRASGGKRLGDVLEIPPIGITVSNIVEDALTAKCDVLIDYTHPAAVKNHTIAAISRRVPVVIGTSGLSEDDFREIDELARRYEVGVLAAGNFAITAVLLQRFALLAAKHLPHWEIIDYGTAEKPDAPSGTARELAARLSEVSPPIVHHPVERTVGPKESRGATVKGTQVHSVRLPGFVSSCEVLFGMPDLRLILRHEAGPSPEPYVAGTLLAAQKVASFIGLKRGLDSVMDL